MEPTAHTTGTGDEMTLTNTPAQTCIALGANYKYGRLGLPGLPARVAKTKGKNSQSARFNYPSSSQPTYPASPRSDSSKGKIETRSLSTFALYQRDLFPSSTHPYDDKILPSAPLPISALTTTTNVSIPATLSRRSSNDSPTSSNSTSSSHLNNKNNRRAGKKVVVIKKNSKSFYDDARASRPHSPSPHLRKTSVMGKSSTHHLPVWSKNNNKEGLGVEMREDKDVISSGDDDDDVDYLPTRSTYFPSASLLLRAPTNSNSTNAKEDENGDDDEEDGGNRSDGDQETDRESNTNKEHAKAGNYNYNTSSHQLTEKVRCIALPLLKQRLGYLWEKKMFTDVIFLVGRNRRKIEAHRVILASCSEVFQSLLYNEGKPMQSNDEKYILYENDFSESALEVFIKAMYTNEIPICLTLAMALEVFYATKKYAVLFLEDQVLEHIRQLLTVSNVFEAMKFSTNAVELTYLAPICWRIVEEKTAEVLEYHLDTLDAHLFARILERDRLSIDEVELFQFAIRWAANQCKINGMKTTGKNKRHFMGPLLKHFRFTTMNPAQFNESVAPSRILEPKEIKQIQSSFHKASDLKNMALPYKSTPRVNTATQIVNLSATAESMRINSKKLPYSNNVPRHHQNPCMDGRGDGQQVQMICSDSIVTAPGVGSKVHYGSGKKGTSFTKLRMKRVPTSNSKAR